MMRRFIASLFNTKPEGYPARATRKQARPRLAVELLDSRVLLSSAPLHVAGNVLAAPSGNTVVLRGVNIASLEWSYTGEHLVTSFDVALNTWHANYIRLPLNEDFWFGYVHSSTPNEERGASYRQRVDDAVAYASARNAYVWLDLHWSDMGQWGANNGQHQMPDDHSTTFWQDVATRYSNNPAVFFGLYNEPHVENMAYAGRWSLWRDGGSITEGSIAYHSPGMQGLLNTVRGTGATNVVLAAGNSWSSDLSGITNGYALTDSAANLGYDTHVYPAGNGDDAARDNRVSAAAADHVVVIGEWGTDPRDNPYPNPYVWVRGMLAWMDRHDYSWTAWDFHPAARPILIQDWNYTPTVPFGQEVFDYLTAKSDHPTVPANPDFPALFSTTDGLSLNGFASAAALAAIPDADAASLRLTDGNNNEARSAWWNQKVNIQSFTTSYQLRVSPDNNAADGCTLTVHNDLRGSAALGGTGDSLGYVGIQNSVAVFFKLYPGVGQIGQYVNGTPTDIVDLAGSGIDLHAGAIYDVNVTYDATQLWVTLTDASNPASTFRTAFTSVDLATVVQDSTAYVGFTGGTSGATSIQDIRQWSFAPAPYYPGGFRSIDGLTIQGFGHASPLEGTALRLTDGNTDEARSAWWNVKQGVESFATTYQLLVDPDNNAAAGCTFTVHDDLRGSAALGDTGDGLGYVGIQNSVAVFFKLYPGVGQIGQYVNGTPTDIVDLTGSGIDLHAGAIYDVKLTYDGSNINVTVTNDANPSNTFSTTFSAVNIPAVVRGTTAYVGFTGGTGAATSIQDILSWSYVDPPASYRPPEPAAGAMPFPAMMQKILPWGERTERLLDVDISDQSRLSVAQRELLWSATLPTEAGDDALPAGLWVPSRDKRERVEWLAASVYGPCKMPVLPGGIGVSFVFHRVGKEN